MKLEVSNYETPTNHENGYKNQVATFIKRDDK